MARRPRPSWYRETTPPKPSFEFEPEDEETVVVLPQVDNSAILARLQLSLVGRMFHQGGRSIEALVNLLPKEHIWDVEGRVRGSVLGDSRFQFYFESEADLQKVLNRRPCHFNKWSFALERWKPHVGTSFPDCITFWIRTEGIPSEFLEDRILTNFGNSFGSVQKVDSVNGRIQVSIKVDVPLPFHRKAQLPTGAIVRVSLFYEKLSRWCKYCRRICHEKEDCPLLSEEQRREYAKEKQLQLSQRHDEFIRSEDERPHKIHSGQRRDVSRIQGESSSFVPKGHAGDKKAVENVNHPPPSNIRATHHPLSNRHHHSKSNYNLASSSYRRHPPAISNPHYDIPHASLKGKAVEDGRKRRHVESFSPERSRASSSQILGVISHKTTGPQLSDAPRVEENQILQPSDSQATVSDPFPLPPKAKQTNASPPFARTRPFRLNLSKQMHTSSKGKEITGESDIRQTVARSESGSSAKKSLDFDTQRETPTIFSPVISLANLSLGNSSGRKLSWYEMTLEEEAEDAQGLVLPGSSSSPAVSQVPQIS